MVKDRLTELQRIKRIPNAQKNEKQKEEIPLNSICPSNASDLLHNIGELRSHVNELQKVQKDILASPQQNDNLDYRLEMITKLIKEKTMAVRSELKSFDLASEDKDPLLLNARERIKLNQHAAISRQLIQVMNSYSKCQLEYREKCKARIRGKLTVAGSSFSEDQIEDMLEKKNPEIFTQSIMASTDAAKRSLLDIEARHADIIRLENSIAELHDLFMTVALMVDNQGDMIDQIEYNVNKAGNCAVQAKKKLSNAVGRKKKHRRCRLICAIILTVLVVLTIIAIASAIGLT